VHIYDFSQLKLILSHQIDEKYHNLKRHYYRYALWAISYFAISFGINCCGVYQSLYRILHASINTEVAAMD